MSSSRITPRLAVALVRRHGRLGVKITFRLVNGSGVTNKRVVSGVIKPE